MTYDKDRIIFFYDNFFLQTSHASAALNLLIYASSFGSDFEQVDIELPEDLPLKEAHAIGETLQIKLEKLPEVERAFVHLDFECDHKPEHSVLSKLPNNQP
jgi:divalent metal cation (Fe/Co/Zn/Cd) transporter